MQPQLPALAIVDHAFCKGGVVRGEDRKVLARLLVDQGCIRPGTSASTGEGPGGGGGGGGGGAGRSGV